MYRADRACPRVVVISVALYADGDHICQAVQVEDVLAIPVDVTDHLLFQLIGSQRLALVFLPFSFIYLT
jgi:hypothetical protein